MGALATKAKAKPGGPHANAGVFRKTLSSTKALRKALGGGKTSAIIMRRHS